MPQSDQRREIELPAGTIRYREAGDGKPVVFVHGFLVDSRLWDGVVDGLAASHRCIAPDWPMGSQQVAMKPDADLTPHGVADLIASFLEQLDLKDVTIVGNDSGGAMSQILVTRHPERIGRFVLTNCDTHENFPPGIFKYLLPLASAPGMVRATAAPLRFDAVARTAYKPFSKRPIPLDLIRSWVEPSLSDRAVRHDLKKLMTGMRSRYTLEAAQNLRTSELPLLLAWAPGDRYFPMKYAERLASEVPNATILQILDSGTFVPIDQPQRLADEIAGFVAAG
jgi:pimeloyl-ACP methyl ester carboxylesterase